ncbi:MAG: DUF456 domain-containing protein [Marinifilaceae bacterium]|nr:DUF456 domain-containing protein [Marinifilaceae bacterium]
MDIVLIVLAYVAIIAGLIGCVVPVLPGAPLAYLGIIIAHLTDIVHFSTAELVIWGVVTLVVQLLDYIAPIIGTKYGGGSKYGNWGCIIGTFAGLFIMPPMGIILCPFIGAIIGEYMSCKDMDRAFKAGFGSFLGFMLGTIIKIILCIYLLIELTIALF